MHIQHKFGISMALVGVMLAMVGCSRKDTARSEDDAGASTTPLAATAPGAANALKLPGACVDAVADARARAKAKDLGDDVADAVASSPAPDLDGDGSPDVQVGLGLGTTVATLLYVTRGRCAQFVGEVNVDSVTALPTKSAGLTDITGQDSSICEGSRAPCKPTKRTYHFDGAAYREVAGAAKAAAKPSSGAAASAKEPTKAAAATKCGPKQHFDAIDKICRQLGDCPKGYRWNESMQSCVDNGD